MQYLYASPLIILTETIYTMGTLDEMQDEVLDGILEKVFGKQNKSIAEPSKEKMQTVVEPSKVKIHTPKPSVYVSIII